MTVESQIWGQIRQEAEAAAHRETALKNLVNHMVLNCANLADSVANIIGRKLADEEVSVEVATKICAEAFTADENITKSIVKDLIANKERDPACQQYLQPLFYYKGFAALQAHRVAHWLWSQKRQMIALHIQSRCSEIFQVDIHPAAKLGSGIFLDHATGIVIGETSIVGDDTTIFQAVTLGGNGKERGDRHPKVGRGVLISVGAKLLGNIKIGDEARVAAGSVVLQDVPAGATVAGVPAKVVRGAACANPAQNLEHCFEGMK